MIAFKDFVPQQTRKQGFIKPPQWETVEQVFKRIAPNSG